MDRSSPLRQVHPLALALSQQTTQFLRRNASVGAFKLPIPFLTSPEATEIWIGYEKLLLSCLRTGDDKAAFLCLEKLMERFGPTNEKVMGLRGLYQEAVAENDTALRKILREYDDILAENPANIPVAKRRVALQRSLGQPNDAIDGLCVFLNSSPTDIEAWSELADLYASQGLYSQAAFCLEEVLLLAPNAWNFHAHLGEILFMIAVGNNDDQAALTECLRRYCRSLELCDDYVRGHYGLKLVTDKLLLQMDRSKAHPVSSKELNNPAGSSENVRELNKKANIGLTKAISRGSNSSYDHNADLVAARMLLDHGTQVKIR